MKIPEETKQQIIKDYATGRYTHRTLAAKHNVSFSTVTRLLNPEYRERERERGKQLRKHSSYEQKKPVYALSLKFFEGDKVYIDKLKSVPNIHEYIKALIDADIKKHCE